jgi:hypothetical protein
VTAEVAGRRFEQFPVDVALNERPTDPSERLPIPSLLDFADIQPIEMPVIALEQHVAEKVHTYTATYGPQELQSTRIKDLIDILLIADLATPNANRLHASLVTTFSNRERQPLPTALPPPPASWVAVARKLVVICWHLLSKDQDYAFARPSLTRQKTRRLELLAGAPRRPRRHDGPRLTASSGQRAAERELQHQAELAYRRTVEDWRSTAPKSGADATLGRASQEPLKGKAARQATSPLTPALRFGQSPAPTHILPAQSKSATPPNCSTARRSLTRALTDPRCAAQRLVAPMSSGVRILRGSLGVVEAAGGGAPPRMWSGGFRLVACAS